MLIGKGCVFLVQAKPVPYVVHYYLADDTIEVAEMDMSGKDPFPLLLSRCQLPRKLPVVGASRKLMDAAAAPPHAENITTSCCTLPPTSRRNVGGNSHWHRRAGARPPTPSTEATTGGFYTWQEMAVGKVGRLDMLGLHWCTCDRSLVCTVIARIHLHQPPASHQPTAPPLFTRATQLLRVYARDMLLIDADEFTRYWYRQQAGSELGQRIEVGAGCCCLMPCPSLTPLPACQARPRRYAAGAAASHNS
jgi:hypothetical protein